MSLEMPLIAVHYAELALKGKNRPMFLKQLMNNIRSALKGEPLRHLEHVESRVLVWLDDPARTEEALVKLKRVFGIQWLSPVVPIPRSEVDESLEAVGEVAVALARQDRGDARHFKVQARRSDRHFPVDSPEIGRLVGGAVHMDTGLPGRMTRPDLTVHVLVLAEHVLVFTRRITAHGGLPFGTGGRVTVLLSGGIDSPVAAWMLMKRGCRPDFVHFYSGRTVAEADVDKIKEEVRILAGYASRPLTLHLIPVFAYEVRAIGNIEDTYDMVMFRRYMVKTAERLARRADSLALVTGDSLGQVASQTLHNLAAISPDVELPIFRPLIGMDKLQITDLARRIGSYETSIRPYRDCCSIRSPRPVLNARARDLLKFSQAMDIDAAVVESIEAMETVVIDHDGEVDVAAAT